MLRHFDRSGHRAGVGHPGTQHHLHRQPVVASGHGPVRAQHLVHAADVQVMHQMAALQVQAVAAGGIAVGDQHTFGAALGQADIGLD